MDPPVDRRRFLAGATAAALGAGLTACGGHGGVHELARGLAAARPPRTRHPRPPRPRSLAEAVRGPVFRSGRPGFTAAAEIYNQRFDRVRPLAVVQPLDEEDARGALRWVLEREVPFRVRSGGHSYAGYSTLEGGVVIDLRRLNHVRVSSAARTATVQAGAQMVDVYAALARRRAALPAGSCPSVGVAGVTLGGGMGLAGRAWGLTSDHLTGARIVTADGQLRSIDARRDPELLWALRGGGGGNFGMVTELTFRPCPLPASAAYFFVSWPWSSAAEGLAAWLDWAPRTDPRLTSIFHLEAGGGVAAAGLSGQFLGPVGELESRLAPVTSVPGAHAVTGQDGWLSLQLRWAGCAHNSLAACHTVGAAPGGTQPRAGFSAKSDYLTRPLPLAGVSQLLGAIERRLALAGSGAVLLDAYGGAIAERAPTATAFVHRDVLCSLQYLSYGGGEQWLAQTHAAMRPFVSGQAYQNYIDPQLVGWQEAYYGQNYRRLLEVRRAIDPDHRFRFPQAIGV